MSKRIVEIVISLAAIMLAPQAADATACYGVTIEIQTTAKEEQVVELFRRVREQHHMANLRPAKRVDLDPSKIATSTTEIQYSSHAEFRCAQALIAPAGRKHVSTILNQKLARGSVLLILNEESPVIYGAQSN